MHVIQIAFLNLVFAISDVCCSQSLLRRVVAVFLLRACVPILAPTSGRHNMMCYLIRTLSPFNVWFAKLVS